MLVVTLWWTNIPPRWVKLVASWYRNRSLWATFPFLPTSSLRTSLLSKWRDGSRNPCTRLPKYSKNHGVFCRVKLETAFRLQQSNFDCQSLEITSEDRVVWQPFSGASTPSRLLPAPLKGWGCLFIYLHFDVPLVILARSLLLESQVVFYLLDACRIQNCNIIITHSSSYTIHILMLPNQWRILQSNRFPLPKWFSPSMSWHGFNAT